MKLQIDERLFIKSSKVMSRGNAARVRVIHMYRRPLTSLFRNMKYIWMKMKAILVAGVRASMMLWHLVFCSSSKYWPNSSPE